MATFIDGIAASENIDSSGERIQIAGMDISTLAVDGVFTYEHEAATGPKGEKITVKMPEQTVGKILKAKKIFSEKDCEDARETHFWQKCKTPYIYIMGELFDDYTAAAQDLAGKFRYDADHMGQNERTVCNFSIEGAYIAKDGIEVTRSVARKCTIAVLPCNKAARAEMVPSKENKKGSNDIGSLFKTEYLEIELFKTELLTLGKMKSDIPDLHKHAAALGITPMQKNVIPFKKPMLGTPAPAGDKPLGTTKSGKSIMPNAKIHEYHGFSSQDHRDAANFHHTAAQAAKDGKTGSHHFNKMKLHMQAGKTAEFRETRLSRAPGLSKALEAGSGMSSPGQLVGGAALQKEDILSNTVAGDRIKRAATHIHRGDKISHKIAMEGAKQAHKEKLDRLKAAPKPNLGKSELEKGGEKSPSIGKIKQKGIFNQKGVHMPHLSGAGGGESVMGSHIRNPDSTGSGSKEMARRHAASNLKDLKSMPKPDLGKSEWLERAEEEYSSWDKKEAFIVFMQKKMPNLAKGEIDAIGRTLALKKSLDAEQSLSRLIVSNNKVGKTPAK